MKNNLTLLRFSTKKEENVQRSRALNVTHRAVMLRFKPRFLTLSREPVQPQRGLSATFNFPASLGQTLDLQSSHEVSRTKPINEASKQLM